MNNSDNFFVLLDVILMNLELNREGFTSSELDNLINEFDAGINFTPESSMPIILKSIVHLGSIPEALKYLEDHKMIEQNEGKYFITSEGINFYRVKGGFEKQVEEENLKFQQLQQSIDNSNKSIKLSEEANIISEKANTKSNQSNLLAIISIIISMSLMIWEIFLKDLFIN